MSSISDDPGHDRCRPSGRADRGSRTPSVTARDWLRREGGWQPQLTASDLDLRERVTGVEPASPAWKAGALAIELNPRGTGENVTAVGEGGFEPPASCT